MLLCKKGRGTQAKLIIMYSFTNITTPKSKPGADSRQLHKANITSGGRVLYIH